MTKKSKHIISGILALALLSGCIENDIPYPRIAQNITSISADGEIAPAEIDEQTMTVSVKLSEQVDIRKVKFNTFQYTEGADPSVNLLEGVYDLTDPLKVTLRKYQSYEWVITATQDIERYFEIEGQIGGTVIDVPAQRVVIKVPDNVSMTTLKVLRAKLGPADVSEMTPDLNGQTYNFSKPVHINVSSYGETQEWTVYVEKTKLLVNTTSADAWSQVVWVYGEGPANATNGFEYRMAESDQWQSVPEQYMTQNGGAFHCYIPHLSPLTKYVVRAVSGQNKGNEIEVETQSSEILPDGSFDQWWLNGKVWCPWDENGTRFWDTGNTGAATLGQSNVIPSDDTPSGTGKSAKLETKFVGIAGIGKLAAGSIYTGSFKNVDGTNGILDFGRPWRVRPTKLRGYMKFHTEPIDYTSSEFKSLMGRPDSCYIYVALTDWAQPYEIRTNPNNRHLLDKNSQDIIGYGELILGDDTTGWQPFEIEIKYRSTSRVPKYIQVTASASKYGDYFTGGTGTVLYIDQFSLDYDY